MKIFSAIEHPQVKINLNSKKTKQPSQLTVSATLQTKRSIDGCSFPKTYTPTGFLSEKISCKSMVNGKKNQIFLLQNLRFHANAATRTLLHARVNQKPGCVRKDSLQLRYGTLLNNLFRNRQDACSTRDEFSYETGILPVINNSARYELQPAEPLKNPVSLILVHHTKSDFNTPFIIESASTHILCVDAVSTAKPNKGDL
ncbi:MULTISPECIES: hypothetical protein [unclassified Microcoleus]|uniref:hypothetical protein n=1 Tax=unclassified Microcoleus TaxID=2642155 RepID=UPI002FD0195B